MNHKNENKPLDDTNYEEIIKYLEQEVEGMCARNEYHNAGKQEDPVKAYDRAMKGI